VHNTKSFGTPKQHLVLYTSSYINRKIPLLPTQLSPHMRASAQQNAETTSNGNQVTFKVNTWVVPESRDGHDAPEVACGTLEEVAYGGSHYDSGVPPPWIDTRVEAAHEQ
jgi:hypothetical protein